MARDRDDWLDELIAYADGEAAPDAVARIKATPGGRGAAAAYAADQHNLRRALFRFECPDPHILGEYELGLVAVETRTRIAAHLVECPRCRDEMRMLREFLITEPLPAPVGMIERMRRVVATLVAAPATPAVGLRGADTDGTRTFRTDDFTISLDSAMSSPLAPAMLTLYGLLWRDIGDDVGGGSVALTAADGTTRTTLVDDLGNFGFDDLPTGTYTLEVMLGETLLIIESVFVTV